MVNIFLGVPAGRRPACVGTWWSQSPSQIVPSGIREAGRTWGEGAERSTELPHPPVCTGVGPLRRVTGAWVGLG